MELDSRPDSPKRQLEEKKEKRSKFCGTLLDALQHYRAKDIPNAPEQVVKKKGNEVERFQNHLLGIQIVIDPDKMIARGKFPRIM